MPARVASSVRRLLGPTARWVLLEGATRTPRYQLDLESEFFKRLPLANGLFKTTCAHRLDDVNRVIQEQILTRWRQQHVRLLDVGVSSGVTTMEWADSLRCWRGDFTLVGTDLFLEAILESYGSICHVLKVRTGLPLQFEVGGFAVSNYVGSGVENWVKRASPVLACRLLVLALRGMRNWNVGPRPTLRRIRLLSRIAIKDPNIEFIEEDLLGNAGTRGAFHVIRVANVLNPRCFSAEKLVRMIRQLRARLESSGILVVLRTRDDGTNDGGVYELDGTGSLRPVWRMGNGSEIHGLIVNPALAANHAGALLH